MKNTANDYVLLELCAMHDATWEKSLLTDDNDPHREVEDLARVITRLRPLTPAGLIAKLGVARKHMRGSMLRELIDDEAEIEIALAEFVLDHVLAPAAA